MTKFKYWRIILFLFSVGLVTLANAEVKINTNQHKIGAQVYALWNGQWYLAEIIAFEKNKTKVHYIGYPTYWDEWLNQQEIDPINLPAETDQIAKKNSDPLTLAFHAIQHGQLSELKNLLTKNITVNSIDKEGTTLLLNAAKNGQLTIVRYLLNHGADLNHVNLKQQSALSLAAAELHWPIVSELLQHGADPNTGTPAIEFAIRSGQYAIVQQFLTRGADIKKTLPTGLTPLALARHFDQTEIAKLLERAGATQ